MKNILKICPKIIIRSITQVCSKFFSCMISYNYRNYVLTLSYDNPKINKTFRKSGFKIVKLIFKPSENLHDLLLNAIVHYR